MIFQYSKWQAMFCEMQVEHFFCYVFFDHVVFKALIGLVY